MGILRRLLGRAAEEGASVPAPAPLVDLDAEERARDLELMQAEADRRDVLQQRQLRYADYAWTPPPQGGERRADDAAPTGDR